MASERMPVVFFGHGNPMHALHRNTYTETWRRIGAAVRPRPRAILAVSAHWYTRGVGVTAMEQPPTIHDFGGFPQALFDIRYPAPGDPALARSVRDLLAPVEVNLDTEWGLDHGTWSVLLHAFPEADIPVVQLSIDATQPPSFHYGLAKRLAPLRDDDVLIVGSGNVVHNLRLMQRAGHAAPSDWALRFNEAVKENLRSGTHTALLDYHALGEDARLSVPTPEHYLPLLYVIALQQPDESIVFPIDGIDMGSLSMLTVVIGMREP